MDIFDGGIVDISLDILDTGLGAGVDEPTDADLAALEDSLDRSRLVSEITLDEAFAITDNSPEPN